MNELGDGARVKPQTTGRSPGFQFQVHPTGRFNGSAYIVRLGQLLNAFEPIEIMLFGIVMLVNPMQPKNAEAPIEVTLHGIVIPVKPV